METDNPIRILFVEDVPADAEIAARELQKGGIQFTSARVDTKEEFLKALEEFQPDIIISDYAMPEFDGMQALKLAKKYDAGIPFIVLTGSMNEETAVECMKAGATDYVLKDRIVRLPFAVQEAFERMKDKKEKKTARQSLLESEGRYRFLFNGITDAVYVHEVSVEKPGNFIAVNDSACSMLGYTIDEFLQMEVKDIDTPEQSEKIPSIHEKLFRDGYALFETSHVTKAGRRIPVEINVRLFELKGKQMALSVARNITKRKQAEEELRNTKEYLEKLTNALPDMIFTVKFPERTHEYVNSAGERILGYNNQECIGKSTRMFYANEDEFIDLGKKLNDAIEQDKEVLHIEQFLKRKNGEVFPGELTLTFLKEDGKVIRLIGIIRDITERKQAEEMMQKLHHHNELILNSAAEGILGLDFQGNHTFINPSAAGMLGYEAEELTGKQSHTIWHQSKEDGSTNSKDACPIYATLKDGAVHHNIRDEVFWRKDGTSFSVAYSSNPIIDEGKIIGAVVNFRDISEQKRMEEKLQHLAYYDALTDLPNRNLFLERINQEIAGAKDRSHSIAVLLTDINKFKSIYDIYGSEVGDRVLKEVAERLSTAVRKGDTVAHLGNNEFGIACIGLAGSDDIIMLEKIIKDISYPLKIDGDEIILTFSSGISLYPHDGENASELLKAAGLALSIAKKEGSKTWQFYTKDMTVTATDVLLLEKQLIKAIKNEEFILHYQPYWDITTKKMVGIEALVRWQSKDNGLVPPGKFIPVLEDTGMIIEVGEWILREATRQVKEWQNNGYPVVPVSVNLSLIQFRQKDLAEMVKKIMGECGFYPSFLTLEITESAFMQDIEFTRSVLTAMKEIGCSISIDDFGTGYSSLAYLKRFPIDNLKIDISFIREMIQDPDSASIVMAIINMAHTLNLKTIAEGIETEEQWNFLRLLRCDMGQGFYLSKPLPAEETERFFKP